MGVVYSEWGLQGVERFRQQVPVLVIVDVLSFSTAVDIAISRGASISPFPPGDARAIRAAANRLGVQAASAKRSSDGQFSLSPTSLETLKPGDRLLLPSPNGSRLCLLAGGVEVLTACLRNAKAVAAKAQAMAAGADLAVIAAGERWPDDSLRPAIEDLIGAGAVIEALDMTLSAEAEVARGAFRAARWSLGEFVRGSVSGQDLLGRGFAHDLELASDLNISGVAPLMRDGAFIDGWA
jgi:2-phosphosulfolactate phosphatase